jgi:Zn-dependent protease with chaperone function
MASAKRLYRLATALAAFGLLATFVGLGTAAARTTLSFPSARALASACRELLPGSMSIAALPILGVAGLGVIVLLRAVGSTWRHASAERRFRARLRVCGRLEVGGTTVVLVDDAHALAFCSGYLRPRVHLSHGAVARLSEAELQAVVAHECHHARWRDPVRLLVARVLADALFFLPALRRLAERYAALAEVAADEAAARAAGAPTLASALLAFNGSHRGEAVVGIAPERVDHLLGGRPRWELPASLFLAALVTLVGLVAAIVSVLAFVGARVDLALFLAQSCMVVMCASGAATAAVALLLHLRRSARAYPG